MKFSIRRFIFSTFLKAGFWIEKSASLSEVSNFLFSLRPHSTNHELIRVGSETDGGYLIPNDLTGISACFSPGVGYNSLFEAEIAALGIKCHLIDFSVESPPIKNELFTFTKKYLGRVNNKEFITFESWFRELNCDPSSEYLLQMDIEGYEYEVIEATTSDFLNIFRIMVIEFHSFSLIRNRRELLKIQNIFTKLRLNFEIVHLHLNNNDNPLKYKGRFIPRTIEVTFLRRDRISSDLGFAKLPHVLDSRNNPANPDYPIPSEFI